MTAERRNGGRTIEEFLERHEFVHTKRLVNRYTEPVRSHDGRDFEMPPSAPRDWLLAFADEIQTEAFDKTFAGVDLLEVEKAWIAFMKTL